MIKNFTKFRIAKYFFLLNTIVLLFSFCIVNISFADEEFPWEIFYPAIIKKTMDKDNDGFTKEQGDCNDSDPSINPDATEICGDGIDQDCSGSDLSCSDVDNDGDGYTENQGDCNDGNAAVHPGAEEVCGDGIDQDCDGSDPPCLTLTCSDIAGYWYGNYTEHHCSGVTVSDNFSMVITNGCNFTINFGDKTASDKWVISNYTISATIPDPYGNCGNYTNTATVDGNHMEGSFSSTLGSSGTFYFNKTP